ncbi:MULTISPECIES: AraC family transcriptional regulator [unclassified Chelatococcus]|uniref:helix-turn-helix transcriptional regulator n=1 Tax=unclassified Chelatococcus TaxID=2638111 RepID=UPI001BCB63C6|nr:MULTISPECIES: AraC family transcriptional regulator [unclassified Chelatococcus]MBS7700579.1 helix-turn-helix transcriptional regulator [Chelatococcus sp. YT9]MBX3558694.1 helix-turn-helix transcriptional regulator [Chelatococcus sp.]
MTARVGGCAGQQTQDRLKRLRVCDFLERGQITLDSPDDGLSPEDTLLAGEFLHEELRRGLTLHVSDVFEEHAFTATSWVREGLSCIFFLDGEVDLRIGDRPFTFRGGPGGLINGAAIMNTRPENFARHSRSPQRLRHVVVSASPEWLNLDALTATSDSRNVARLFNDHLTDHRWSPPPRVAELVRQLISPSVFLPELRNLYLEGRAVEIVGETLAAVMHSETRIDDSDILTRKDKLHLARAKEFIGANLAASLSVDVIAREAGINAGGLQRLFRRSEGQSLFEYVRTRRLERAFAVLSAGECTVHDASLLAGYSSPANFATAFRRQFGMAPRDAMSGRAR